MADRSHAGPLNPATKGSHGLAYGGQPVHGCHSPQRGRHNYMRTSVAKAFVHTEEINRAEAITAILGLSWACSEEFLNTFVILWVDNSAVFATLRQGTGVLWRFHDLRQLYLSMLHSLRDNTWEVRQVAGLENPADRSSRAVLAALFRKARLEPPPTRRAKGLVMTRYHF